MNPYVKGYTICVTAAVLVSMLSVVLSAEEYLRS